MCLNAPPPPTSQVQPYRTATNLNRANHTGATFISNSFFFLPEMELTALRNSLPLLLMHTNEARATVIHQLNQQHSLFTAFVERTVHKHNFFMIMMIKIMMLWSQGSVACLSLDSCFSMRIKATLLFWSTLSSLDWHCLWESHQGFLQE